MLLQFLAQARATRHAWVMTPVKASTAIAIMVIAAAGFAVVAFGAPGVHRLHMALDSRLQQKYDAETRQWAEQLIDSRVASWLDPSGDAKVRHALALDDKAQHGGGLEIADLGIDNDPTWATDEHQVQVAHMRIALMILFGGLLLGSLGSFILWWRDSRSDLWHLATAPVTLALFPLGYVISYATPLGLLLIPLYTAALVTVGRESVRAFRLRTPDEIP